MASGGANAGLVTLTPSRILNTRASGKIGNASGTTDALTLNVFGKGGLPSSGISAVVLNVTVVDPEVGNEGGYLTVYPCATGRPEASNINFTNGLTIPNNVIAPVDTNGNVCFYSYGKTHILADVSGYFPTNSSLVTLKPSRVVNTRTSSKVGEVNSFCCQDLTIDFRGKGGLPSDGIGAVVLNVTVVDPEVGSEGGYVSVAPCFSATSSSNLNFVRGQTIANTVITPTYNGTVCFKSYGKVHILADVSGYFPADSAFSTVTPTRVVDTRLTTKIGNSNGKGEPLVFNVLGQGNLPSTGVSAVVLNVTAVDPEVGNEGGYVTVYPCDKGRPEASNINFVNGQTIPNSVITPVDTNGNICFYSYGRTHILADVAGYFRPSPTFDYSSTSVLSVQSVKLTKFEALQNLNILEAQSSNQVEVQLADGSIRFLSEDVVGLGLPETRSSNSSGLLAITAAGISTEALVSGSATILNFYAAPNAKYYVVFDTPAELVPSGPTCKLAEVNQSSGIPTCVDLTLNHIDFSSSRWTPEMSPIQFDDNGAIYYKGETASGQSVLRKWQNGINTELINGNISIGLFQVLGDGTVLLSGATSSSGASWLRKLSPLGSLVTLSANSQISFMSKFPDGNIYLGESSSPTNSVIRYLVSTKSLEPKAWILGGWGGGSYYYSSSEYCSKKSIDSNSQFCFYPSYARNFFWNGDQSVFAISGWSGGKNSLYKYFPEIEKMNTVVTSISLIESNENKVIIAGTGSDGTSLLTIFDTTNGQETILIDSTNEIEVYNMTYVAATNKIMFNGLRFADNKQVIGEIDLN